MAQPTSQSDKPRRAKRSIEQQEAEAQAELARLAGMRRKMLEGTVTRAVSDLKAIANTSLDIGPLKTNCGLIAVDLQNWLAAGKPGAG